MRKAGKINWLKIERKEALAAIWLSGIIEYVSDTVMKYALDLLLHATLLGTVGIGTAACLLKKLWERGKLVFGHIQHASIDDLGNWMAMIEEAKQNPNITVNSGEIVPSSSQL